MPKGVWKIVDSCYSLSVTQVRSTRWTWGADHLYMWIPDWDLISKAHQWHLSEASNILVLMGVASAYKLNIRKGSFNECAAMPNLRGHLGGCNVGRISHGLLECENIYDKGRMERLLREIWTCSLGSSNRQHMKNPDPVAENVNSQWGGTGWIPPRGCRPSGGSRPVPLS